MPCRLTLAVLTSLAVVPVPVSGQDSSRRSTAANPPTYDVVIRDGRVLDGAGNPWIAADIAIRDGRIARIGMVEGEGRREIDATGLYVSPGFIDMMDQSGGVLPRNGLAENKLRMGVTTAIGGEGGTPVGVDSIAAYFRTLEEQGISINFGSYFSETQARVAVLGNADRAPTGAELDEMRDIMARAMRQGAIGMTTALIYPPSSFASTDELVEVAKVAGAYGGIYASHIRDEGEGLVGAVREAIEIGERAGLPVEIFHYKGAFEPGWGVLIKEAAEEIDEARARGVDVAADMYPYTAGGTGLEATIPSWVFDGGRDSVRARIGRDEVRAQLKEQLVTGYDGWWNIVEAAGGWDRIVLVNARSDDHAHFEGMSLTDIAAAWGKDPADAAWDLVAAGEGRVMAIYHMMSEDDVRWALQLPWTSIGSDAGAALTAGAQDAIGLPHPRSYGTFPRILGKYVRDEGVLTLPEAVRKMTSWPATRMRLEDRGVLREGAWADITVFDLARVRDAATYDEPVLFPEGIEYVLVNGEVVIEEGGNHTGARPGHVLYGPGLETAGPGADGDGEAASAQDIARVAARLEPEIRRAMLEGNIPSLTIALTDREGELWSGAYGESNLWARTPASTNTVYLIGSTFKAQSTVALLQQMEQGSFALDDPVSDYLDDLVIRREDMERPVTFRNLLTHTSGMPVDFGPHAVWGETAPLSLDEYLRDSLRVDTPPLEAVVYSNMAYSLVGHLVERFSGVPYKQYIRERIWGALGMTSTAFDPPPEMAERLAVPYAPDEDTGRNTPAVRVKANVWPAGIVYGTVHDQASWVRFNLGDGTWNGQRLLEAATLDEMHTLQFEQFAGTPLGGGWGYEDPGYGLTWWVSPQGGERFFAHSGSVSGYTAFASGNRTRGFGVAFLTNGNRAHPHLVRLTRLALDLLADEIGQSR